MRKILKRVKRLWLGWKINRLLAKVGRLGSLYVQDTSNPKFITTGDKGWTYHWISSGESPYLFGSEDDNLKVKSGEVNGRYRKSRRGKKRSTRKAK